MRSGATVSRRPARQHRTLLQRHRAVAVVAVLVAVGAASCSSTPSAGVVGDSITVMTADELDASEPDWDVEAVIGATAGEMLAPAERLAERSPDQVVLNVGTNDALERLGVDDATAQIDRLVSTFDGARCVHLVTISTGLPPTGDPLTPTAGIAEGINDWISARAEQDDRIRVVDWDAEVAAEPDLMLADGIHPDDAGQQRLAEMMTDALAGC